MDVCVIIAAKDAESTVATAVSSALAEPQVARVMVVDDGSSDATGDAAMSPDDGTGRLRLIRLDSNRGPAYARNRALEVSREPLVAVLDADDFFLPGRFTQLFSHTGWDFIADNIAFIPEAPGDPRGLAIDQFQAEPSDLSLEQFVLGNLKRGRPERGELGFLKPVMRRAFLDQHRLAWQEDLRLGEDYQLYANALAAGARFRIVRTCGYAAVQRAASLSGRHRAEDLFRLAEADLRLLRRGDLDPAERSAVSAHRRETLNRYRLRRFLASRRQKGVGPAIAEMIRDPAALPAVALGVASDKLAALAERLGHHRRRPSPRYLLAAGNKCR